MKRLLSLSICLMIAMLSFAHDFEVDGIYYNITSSSEQYTVEVTSGAKYSGMVTIPATVYNSSDGKTYQVTGIGDSAFKYCSSLTTITIPNSVTSIGSNAFDYCSSLVSVTIGENVTAIGSYAFSGCRGLTSVTIPNSVTTIGELAFSYCSGLTSITIGNGVKSIGFNVFSCCSSLNSIIVADGNPFYDSRDNCNAIIETESNTLIQGCKTTIIPNSITVIGILAFSYCSGLTSVTIPESVTSIDYGAFEYCSGLTSLEVAEGNPIYDSRDNCNAIIATASNTLIAGCKNTFIPYNVTSIGANAFSGCSSLTSVTIPNSVTSIGNYAFRSCTGLTSITLPESVTSIGYGAFQDCTALTNVYLSDRISEMGALSFYSCSSLKGIVIPQSLRKAYSDTYHGCTSVESVVVRKSMPIEIASDFFEESIYKNATLYVPTGRRKYFKNAPGWENFNKIEEIEMEGVEISDSPYDNIENNQMKLGYYITDEISSNVAYGGANAGHYRACIGFSKEQMAPFVGNSITNVRFALLNTDILNTKLWIGSTREKDDVYVQNVTTLKEGWNEVALSTPISITGDSIFIGIEYEQNGSNYPLSCLSEGAEVGSYYMRGPYNGSGKDEIWLDTSNSGRSLSLQCIVEGDQLPQYDIHTVKMTLSQKYLKAGEEYDGLLYFRNWGKKDITSHTSACNLDGKEIATIKVSAPLGQGINTRRIRFIPDAALSPGIHTLTLRVKEINGEKPVFTADDAQSMQVKFYSKDMGRDKVLLELYTATWCPNTPRAHKSIAKLMEERDDIVLVSNHIDDAMSCEASDAYRIFTNMTPDWYYNRYASYGDTSLGAISVDKAKATPSLAKLSIEGEYTEGSREARITVKGVKNDEFDAVEGYANLTVLLTEDNIVSPQNDGESGKYIFDYVHNGVLRTNVSDIWGDPIVWNGDTFEKNYTVKLNEDWVKDNMRVVAYLAKPFNGSNYDEIELVNCNDYALKNAPVISGITLVQQTSDIMLFDNGGSIGVKGNYSAIQVYTPYGVKVGNRNLQAGTYIVKVKTQQGSIIKKINIR